MAHEKASLKKICGIKGSFVHCIIKKDVVGFGTLHKWQDDEVDQKIANVWGEIKYIWLHNSDAEEANRVWLFTISSTLRTTSNQSM